MIDNKDLIKVTNRDNGHVGYSIPDLNNLTRTFSAGETKEITAEELRKLSYITGGKTLLRDYLIVDNEELVKELLNEVEPEYYYTEKEIKELLLNGSLDALKDCLDYAPVGTIDILKKLAVELPLNDVAKRKAILEMTGFDVNSAIMVNEATKEEEEDTKKVRRVTSPIESTKTNAASGRRVAIVSSDKYKIVNMK